MRAALVNDNNVVDNIIEYDSDSDYDPTPYTVVEITDELVGLNWIYRDNTFVEPPSKSLQANPPELTLNPSNVSTLTYKNTFEGAPSEVVFDVNGSTVNVALVDGLAQLEVVAEYLGDILVTCDDLMTTITVVEA